MDYYADLGIEIDGFAKGGMPARNKKNFTDLLNLVQE
jgi:hypothetical protein